MIRSEDSSAFPIPNLQHYSEFNGLSKREYFAAHVNISDFRPMAVLEIQYGFGKVTVAQLADYIAELRFTLADAMIKEGSKP